MITIKSSPLPDFWTTTKSPYLFDAISYYRRWLSGRHPIPLDRYCQYVVVVKIYLIEYLSHSCWGNGSEIQKLRRLADEALTIEQIADLHKKLTTHGIEPIHF